jgi:hypothetical protein
VGLGGRVGALVLARLSRPFGDDKPAELAERRRGELEHGGVDEIPESVAGRELLACQGHPGQATSRTLIDPM